MFTKQKFLDFCTIISDETGVNSFLIEGKDKAMLIDTCAGIGNIKAYVDSLTKKEYAVILTHGHPDHAGGACLFDKVYLNSKDIELKDKCCLNEKELYAKSFGITDMSLLVKEKKQTLLPLEDGQEFDLGGITLKMIACPGHTQGSMCVMIKDKRIIILGDACNRLMFMFGKESTKLSILKKSLLRIKSMRKDFDKTFFSHGLYDDSSKVIEGCLEVIDEIEARKDDRVPFNFLGEEAILAKKVNKDGYTRVDGKIGNIVYSLSKLDN